MPFKWRLHEYIIFIRFIEMKYCLQRTKCEGFIIRAITNYISFNEVLTQWFWRKVFCILQSLTSQDIFAPGPSIGFNRVSSDPFMSHLATQLGYTTGEFQALQLIVLVAFGVVDQPFAPCMLATFWKSTFRQQLGCIFDIMDCKSSMLFHMS